MSALSQFRGGGIKSIQTGEVDGVTAGSGSGAYANYTDVTISAVVVAKSVVFFSTASSTGNGAAGKLTSTTNLRLGSTGAFITGQWTVVEFK